MKDARAAPGSSPTQRWATTEEGVHAVGPGDLGRVLLDDAKEDLQVERRRKQRVGPGTSLGDAKVIIDKCVTEGEGYGDASLPAYEA